MIKLSLLLDKIEDVIGDNGVVLFDVWMSYGDKVVVIFEGFEIIV